MMGSIANVIMVVFLIASIIVLYLAKKAKTIERKTVLGGVLYLTLNLVLMSSGQWKQPQSFYMKYGPEEMQHQIREMQKELDHMNWIKQQMIYLK